MHTHDIASWVGCCAVGASFYSGKYEPPPVFVSFATRVAPPPPPQSDVGGFRRLMYCDRYAFVLNSTEPSDLLWSCRSAFIV
jgi:hypothetical protein